MKLLVNIHIWSLRCHLSNDLPGGNTADGRAREDGDEAARDEAAGTATISSNYIWMNHDNIEIQKTYY